jgi:hypothetical protein
MKQKHTKKLFLYNSNSNKNSNTISNTNTRNNYKYNYKKTLKNGGGCGCSGNKVYRLSGGAEFTQENKKMLNNEIKKEVQKLEEKTASTMNPSEYNNYASQINALTKKSEDPRNTLTYEYMFSPLLTKQMQKNTAAVKGKFFIGVNLIKMYSALKKIFSGNNNSNLEDKDTFKYLGDWVNEYKNYEKILRDDLGYRNDNSDLILKPEDELRNNSSFKNIVSVSKKYSGFDNYGKITPYGLLKLIKILDKYKKSDSQWLRAATVLEIIYKYLSKGRTRPEYFKSKEEIPMHIIFELEEFYTTEHMFLSKEEILEFKNKLNYYKNKE